MTKKCEICGSTENLQRHHVSYEPGITQILCVDCHKKVHNHGVGKAQGWSSMLKHVKENVEALFKAGAANKEIAEKYGISDVTASHWRKRVGLGRPGETKQVRKKRRFTKIGKGMKYIITTEVKVRQSTTRGNYFEVTVPKVIEQYSIRKGDLMTPVICTETGAILYLPEGVETVSEKLAEAIVAKKNKE